MNEIEKIIIDKVINNEWTGSESLAEFNETEFLSYLRLIDNIRDEKEYDWMSNIRIPEFASQMLTQCSIDVDQYFKSRDFVEVYQQDESNEAIAASGSVKELLNRTLNQTELHYYLKYVRAKLINHLTGRVYAECWWDQDIKEREIGQAESEETGKLESLKAEVILKDHFNFDVIDPRHIRVSPEYAYSAREKEWILVKKLKSFAWLEKNAEKYNFINLDKIKGKATSHVQEQLNKKNEDLQGEQVYNPNIDMYELITRYGLFWAVVDEVDPETLAPTKVSYGFDEDGSVKENAELVECQIIFAKNSGTAELICFKVSPFVDVFGQPYKPIIRGLCYVHPTDDEGMGDGKYGRDLQTGIDDTFNLANDRTMLATMPVFKGRKYSMIDNDTVYFEPEHVIEVENMDDLQEIKIDDNIQGALQQLGFLIGKTNQAMSIYPTTMGNMPSAASTTATAVAGAATQTNIRTGFKSVTFENTFLNELYWMIVQLTAQFAQELTAKKLMGEKLLAFDPMKDYWYKPVSQAIDSEQSKNNKIKNWITILGYVSQIQHPDAMKQINHILTQVYTFMGDEYVNFGKQLYDESVPAQGGAGQQAQSSEPVSNQNAVPQSQAEQLTRSNAGGY
jgi:hypothetical protein